MNKEKIAILTDSGSDVPDELVRKYNMKVIPLKIIYKDGEYIDKVTITADEVYERLEEEIPKTSLPDGAIIKEMLDEIKQEGYEKVIAVTISSGLSGTFNMVHMIASEYEGLDIYPVDTKNIGIASGLTAILAATEIEKGTSWSDLKEKITNLLDKTTVFFHVPSLEYLQKGGRIGLVASVVGSMLNLKPIITCNEDGIYHTVAKVRGKSKSITKTIELVEEFSKNAQSYNLAIAYGGEEAREEAERVAKELVAALPNGKSLIMGQISPALGVHTGPGLIGVGIQVLD